MAAKRNTFLGWDAAGKSIYGPDTQITAPDPSHSYEPMRGYCAVLAVRNAAGQCIGWIDTRTLGFERAGEWMQAQK